MKGNGPAEAMDALVAAGLEGKASLVVGRIVLAESMVPVFVDTFWALAGVVAAEATGGGDVTEVALDVVDND